MTGAGAVTGRSALKQYVLVGKASAWTVAISPCAEWEKQKIQGRSKASLGPFLRATGKWADENGFKLHTIVGDGSCLCHALGKMDKSKNTEVRKLLINRAPDLWAEVMHHDVEGTELQGFLDETADFPFMVGQLKLQCLLLSGKCLYMFIPRQ